jgi:hypothetical protein
VSGYLREWRSRAFNFPRSYLVNRAELAAPVIETMGEKNICLMKDRGITVTGKTIEDATVRW